MELNSQLHKLSITQVCSSAGYPGRHSQAWKTHDSWSTGCRSQHQASQSLVCLPPHAHPPSLWLRRSRKSRRSRRVQKFSLKSQSQHLYSNSIYLIARYWFLFHNRYVLTPASRLLLKDEPLNARAFPLIMLDPIITQPWNILSDWFHNDESTAFDTTYGKSFWEYQADEPRLGNFFNEAMASDSRLIVRNYFFKIKKCD